MRAIIVSAERVPGLFNVLILETGERFWDLTVTQVERLIQERGLVAA